MKKTIFSLTAALMAVSASAQMTAGTDIFSVQSLTEAGLNVPAECDWSAQNFTSLATGTPYVVSNVSESEGKLIFSSSLGIKNTEAHCYLKEVRLAGASVNEWGSTGFTVYAANEPISNSPFMQEGVVTLYFDTETFTAKADAPFTYIGVWTYEACADAVEIEWSDEAPVAAAAKPYIMLNSMLGCPSGSTITIDSDTSTASIEVKMTKGDEVVLEETFGNPCTLTLEGEVGDKITVEARAVAEGWNPSEWAKKTYTITNPMLMEPEFSLYPYSSVVTLGDNVFITNPNVEGSLLTYSVCGGDPVSTLDYSVSIPVEGTVGDSWSVAAWCTMEGYDDSAVAEWEGVIDSNVCPEPYFTPEAGEYAKGTSISISARYPAQSVTYRINGGEWTTSSSLWNLSVMLDEDMTIEAYSSASFPYVDSETVTAVFTVEKIAANCDEIVCSTFGEVGESAFATYVSEVSANGAVYSFMGRDFSGGMFLNGEGEIATVSSTAAISRIKIEARFGNKLIVYLSDSPIAAPDASLESFTVIDGDYEKGEWIDIDSEKGYGYFYVTTDDPSMANVIDRMIVAYDVDTKVTEVPAAESVEIYYDMTGRRVMNLASGLVIRVENGKASKVILK